MRSIKKDGCFAIDLAKGASELSPRTLQYFGDTSFIPTLATGANFDVYQVAFHRATGVPGRNEHILGHVSIVFCVIGADESEATAHGPSECPADRVARSTNGSDADHKVIGAVKQTPFQHQLLDDST